MGPLSLPGQVDHVINGRLFRSQTAQRFHRVEGDTGRLQLAYSLPELDSAKAKSHPLEFTLHID